MRVVIGVVSHPNQTNRGLTDMAVDAGPAGHAPVILVVGNMRDWAKQSRVLPRIDGFHFAGFHEITPAFLARLNPEIVLSALIADQFDAIDLARRLSEAGFQGRYRAVTNDLPNPRAITSEVRAAAPGIDFDIYIIDRAART